MEHLSLQKLVTSKITFQKIHLSIASLFFPIQICKKNYFTEILYLCLPAIWNSVYLKGQTEIAQ